MKINPDFVLRTIAGEKVVVPTGDASQQLNGMLMLNEVGAFIWENVEKVSNEDEMAELILENYEVERELAYRDAYGFMQMLRENSLLKND